MRARAPGKLVLSGAYAVLEGAPAIVAAVDRFVVADTSRPAELVTDEVRVALTTERPPWFDASALRSGDRKLGLGSSAAILVASLAALALEREPRLDHAALVERVLGPALSAHARAQAGGSGVDVAASAHGGVIVARRTEGVLGVRAHTLPASLEVTVLAASHSASTRGLLERVRELRIRDREQHARLLAAQAEASERATRALDRGDATALVRALAEQGRALAELGRAARAPIVTPELELLQRLAGDAAAVLPAGAGGGDVALWITTSAGAPPPAATPGFERLSVSLGAPGVCGVD